MLRDGTILLWDKRKTNKGLALLISKAIVKVTGSPITHVGIFLDGRLYEQDRISRMYQGLIISQGRTADMYLELKDYKVSKLQAQRMITYITETYSGRRYNAFKLFALAIITPLRGFFDRLGWVPFDAPWMGEVCSVMPDEAYKSIGVDLFPDAHEGYTVPGDYFKTKSLVHAGANVEG